MKRYDEGWLRRSLCLLSLLLSNQARPLPMRRSRKHLRLVVIISRTASPQSPGTGSKVTLSTPGHGPAEKPLALSTEISSFTPALLIFHPEALSSDAIQVRARSWELKRGKTLPQAPCSMVYISMCIGPGRSLASIQYGPVPGSCCSVQCLEVIISLFP